MSGAANRPTPSSAPVDRAPMMVVPDFATNDRLVDAARLVHQERLQAQSSGLQYRLAVLGTNTTELVRHAGGLMFDHLMAGWWVTVLVPQAADPRPLQILGTRLLDLDTALALHLDSALAAPRHTPWPDKVVIAGDLCNRNSRLRDAVRRSFQDGTTTTMLWGQHPATVDDSDVTPVEHQLSNAARAFKSHALSATPAGATDVAESEYFLGNRVSPPHPPEPRPS